MLFASATLAHAGHDEPIYVVDSPTAGLLAHGEYHIQGRLGPDSSILLAFRVGIRNAVHLGVSWGMQGVFERGDVSYNDRPGLMIRVRLLQETEQRPALVLGFDSQGAGAWDEIWDRYERKSTGFYGAVSKNWRFALGQTSLHGGLNYSTETTDEAGVDFFAAADYEPFHGLSLLLDWDGGLDDKNIDGVYGGGKTYLDAAIRVTYGDNISMMLVFRDLTGNYEPQPRVWREFEIAFVDLF